MVNFFINIIKVDLLKSLAPLSINANFIEPSAIFVKCEDHSPIDD